MSLEEEQALLAEYGINKSASFAYLFIDLKEEADKMRSTVSNKYSVFIKKGAEASSEFAHAREDYDKVIKLHDDYFKATNMIGKKIVQGLLGVAASFLGPVGAKVVNVASGALFGDFTKVNGAIGEILPNSMGFVADLATGILPNFLPQLGQDVKKLDLEGGGIIKGMTTMYRHGIQAKFEDVNAVLNRTSGEVKVLSKNLRKLESASNVDEAAVDKLKSQIIMMVKKWKALSLQIDNKYLQVKEPTVNTNEAYHNASVYLYTNWIIKFPKKEIRIADVLIKTFGDFGIMRKSGAEWKTGFWAKTGRSFFGFFKADPFDYREELDKMKKWSFKEVSRLKTAAAWSKVFV
jgi:hypothetical protein